MKNEKPFKFHLGNQTTPLFDKYCGIYDNLSIRRFQGTTDKELKTPFIKKGMYSEKQWKNACKNYNVKIMSRKMPEDVSRTVLGQYL